MALPQGINFRQTAGYVTDGANEDWHVTGGGSGNLLASSYPTTTAQGNNVGWEGLSSGDVGVRDDSSSVDRRLAGCHFVNPNLTRDFRIDLPSAGNYNIRFAAGRATYSGAVKVELFDTSSSLGVLASGSTGAAGSYRDATNTILTAANWPGSNTAAAKTFATTICRFRIGEASATDVISHIYIESAGGGTTPKTATFTDSLAGGELV